ncbi:MAG: efflux RND transporter periplasmic adaptor subunit [Planctomycetes bacterium]|nr:efflux RND transporter periplasmic adaptor subunit [Planctomycetota bacterium]
MAVDLEMLRLDIPEEDFAKPDGVSRFWRFATFALVLVLGALGYLQYVHKSQGAADGGVAVTTHTVEYLRPDSQIEFTAGGWIEPQWPYPVTVSAMVPGRVDASFAVEGLEVKSGSRVAVVNSEVYETELWEVEARVAACKHRVSAATAHLSLLSAGSRPEEIEIAKATRDSARAKLDRILAGNREEDIQKAEANVREAVALAVQKRARADRLNKLAESHQVALALAEESESLACSAEERVLSLKQDLRRLQAGHREVDIEVARTEFSEAERKLELIQAGTRVEDIQQAKAELEAAKAQLEAEEYAEELANWRVEQCTVKSPRSGRILEVLAPTGAVLSEKEMALFTLYDPSAMQCRVDVRQEQAAALFVGQACTIKLAARKGKPYTGRVIRINPQANLARDTIRAIVSIDEPDESLRKDMTVTVDFHPRPELEQNEALPLVLPPAAIHKRDGKSYVFRIRGALAELREVELGEELSQGFKVVAGVSQGDMVAITGLALLDDGAPVRLELEARQ